MNSTPNSLVYSESKRVKDFLQTYCLLSRDQYHGRPIQLMPWQVDFLDQFFGTGTWEGDFFRRTFRHARVFCPRKNGKSSLMSGLAVWFALEKHGNEVLVVASNIAQAKIIFNETKYMVETHPALRKIFWVRDHLNLIKCTHNNSIIKVISSNPSGVSGWNGDVIADEICEWQPSTAAQVWGKLANTGASRKNAAFISISSSNYFMGEHIGYQEFLRSKAILEARAKGDPDPDPQCLPIIYAADPDRWEDPEEWARSNPGWGRTIDPQEFEADYRRAKANPRDVNRFKLFRLNIFTGSLEAYIPDDLYQRAEVDITEDSLYGLPAYASIDLSRRRDLTVWMLLVPKDGLLYFLPRIFTPANTLETKSRQDKVDYVRWAAEGHIIATPGDTIQQEDLLPYILEDASRFDIRCIRYDPWNADLLAQAIAAEQLLVEEFACNRPSAMISPTGELERQFIRGTVRVPRNPCMRWCFNNAVVKQVGADGVIVNKAACSARVDACICAILSTSGWMAHQDQAFADFDSMITL